MNLKSFFKKLLYLVFPFLGLAIDTHQEKKSIKRTIIITTIATIFFFSFWNNMLSDTDEITILYNKISKLNKTIETKNKLISENDNTVKSYKDNINTLKSDIDNLKFDLAESEKYGKLTDKQKADLKKKQEHEEKEYQLELEKKKKEEKLKEQKKKYKEWIEKQFSVWDGSCKKLKEMTINSLNDPDSFEHISTKYWEQKDMKSIIVKMEFTAKNGFGGTVRNTAHGKLLMDTGEIVDFSIY